MCSAPHHSSAAKAVCTVRNTMDHYQRTSKSRADDMRKQTKTLEELHRSQVGISGNQNAVSSAALSGGPNLQYVNEEFIRQHCTPVSVSMKGGPAVSTGSIPTHINLIKSQQGADLLHHSGVSQTALILKSEKEDSLSFSETSSLPLHTTKSSSLSRDISPSRITAQVVSAMSESTQPLLLSALTGNMPASLLLGASGGKAESLTHVKHKQAESASHGVPSYNSSDQRRSPVPHAGRMQTDSRGVKAHAGIPSESSLLGATLQVHDAHGRSSPGRPAVGIQQHQGLVAQLTESRTQTPSPKPVSAARSPQRHITQQGQRRSPMMQRSRPSPVPSPAADVMTSMSIPVTMSGPGVKIPLQQMALVQQHLLAGTLKSTATTTTTVIPNTYDKSGSTLGVVRGVQQSAISSAPSNPSVGQSTVRLATIPIDMSSPGQKAKSSKNSHAISVGTATDARRFASHGAQTRLVPSHAKDSVNSEGILIVNQEDLTVSRGSQACKVEEGIKVREGVIVSSRLNPTGVIHKDITSDAMNVSPVHLLGDVGNGVVGDGELPSGVLTLNKVFTTLSSSPMMSSQTADLTSTTGVLSEHRKLTASVSTSAHDSKPISVPSSHSHVHVHHPSSLPGPHIPVTSAHLVPSTVNHVSSTPVTQPMVSLSRMPITTAAEVQPFAVRVKAEPKGVTGVVAHTTQTGTSAIYQPHHQHYHHHSQPAQTITSQVSNSGPVVKDFISMIEVPEPPPYHQPPLPPHINPFTFPTSGVKVHYSSGDGPSYSLIGQDSDVKVLEGKDVGEVEKRETQLAVNHKSVSDITGLQKLSLFTEAVHQREDMPRLTPEGLIAESKCQHVFKHGSINTIAESVLKDGTEQLANPFNQRLQNLNNFPSMATSYRSAYRSHSVAMQRAKAGIIMSSAKSLDGVRENFQKDINQDLAGIINKYVEKFFRPAAHNICINNGPDAVSEEHINAVCRQVLEEAKKIYTTEARRGTTPRGDSPDNVSDNGSVNGKRIPSTSLKRVKASDSDSEKGSDSGIPKKVPRRKGRPPLNSSGRSTPFKPAVKMDNIKREGPKWDPERVKPDTLFVMGARANKALGLGNTRGRLYIRHPDVFKYSGDQEDKVWLHEQKLMPATGGKAYMLIVEDIIDLSKTEDYRDSQTLMMHECQGFQVPEWMRVKIKESMRAMSSDGAKRSSSRSPLTERPEPPKTLPFSNLSDTASNNDLDSVGNKNSLQPSPADTEEIEFLSAVDNEDTQPSDISAFNMTGGFEDTSSHSPCPLDPMEDDPCPIAVPFT